MTNKRLIKRVADQVTHEPGHVEHSRVEIRMAEVISAGVSTYNLRYPGDTSAEDITACRTTQPDNMVIAGTFVWCFVLPGAPPVVLGPI